MVMPCLDTDLTAVFSANDFGETLGTVMINAVVVGQCFFDDEDMEVQTGEGVSQIVHAAYVTAPTAQLPVLAQGQPAVVRGLSYLVQYWMDDGNGVTRVYLERVTG